MDRYYQVKQSNSYFCDKDVNGILDQRLRLIFERKSLRKDHIREDYHFRTFSKHFDGSYRNSMGIKVEGISETYLTEDEYSSRVIQVIFDMNNRCQTSKSRYFSPRRLKRLVRTYKIHSVLSED